MTLFLYTIHRENQGKQKESHEVQQLPCYADREAIDILPMLHNAQGVLHKSVLYFTIAVYVIVVA